jgi:transposase-like protein
MSKDKPRRKFTVEFKREIARAIIAGEIKSVDVQKQHNIVGSVVSTWVKQAKAGKLADRKDVVVVRNELNGRVKQSPPFGVGVDVLHVRSAISFLRHANHELKQGIRDGTIDDIGPEHCYARLALKALQGA